MEQLSARVLKQRVPDAVLGKERPEKILQFGKGNFLRGFFGWQVEKMNQQRVYDGSIVLYQPAPRGSIENFLQEQDYLYTVAVRGMQNGETTAYEEIVSSLSRTLANDEWQEVLKLAASPTLESIVSNTTEAGLVYEKEESPAGGIPMSFPAKMTRLLWERYAKLGEAAAPPLLILPCELVEQNGDKLEQYVQQHAKDWKLPDAFLGWLEQNEYCNTLVDRIVTGYPKDQEAAYEDALGYQDSGLVVTEPYYAFTIEGSDRAKETLPLTQAGLNVTWGSTADHRRMKVGLLNGPHTIMSSVGILYGLETVQEAVKDPFFRQLIQLGTAEIQATLPFSTEEMEAFTEAAMERFQNPYNPHYLKDIALNSVNKFKSRLLPALEEHRKNSHLPKTLVMSLAALLLYYQPVKKEDGRYYGRSNDSSYLLQEDEELLQYMYEAWQLPSLDDTVHALLQETIWGQNLAADIPLKEKVLSWMKQFQQHGVKDSLIHSIK